MEVLPASGAGPGGPAAACGDGDEELRPPASPGLQKRDSGYGSLSKPSPGRERAPPTPPAAADDDEPGSPMDSEAPLLEPPPPAPLLAAPPPPPQYSLSQPLPGGWQPPALGPPPVGAPAGDPLSPPIPIAVPKRSFSKKKGARLSVHTAPPQQSSSAPAAHAPAPHEPPHHAAAKDTDSLKENPYKYGPAQILPYLYLGCKDNARDAEVLSSLGIRYLVNVAKEVRNPLAGEGSAADLVRTFCDGDADADPTRREACCDDAGGEGLVVGEFGVCREVVARVTVPAAPGQPSSFGPKYGNQPAQVECLLIGRDTWPRDAHPAHPPAPTAAPSALPPARTPLQRTMYSSIPPHRADALRADLPVVDPPTPTATALPPLLDASAGKLSRATSEFFPPFAPRHSDPAPAPHLALPPSAPRRMPSFDIPSPRSPDTTIAPRSPSVPPTAQPRASHALHSPRAARALSHLPPAQGGRTHVLHLHSLHLPWTHSQCIRRPPSPGGRPCQRLGWSDEMEYAMAIIDHARQSHAPLLLSCSLGVARSASLAIAYAMRTLSLDLGSAYAFVRSRAPGVMPDVGMMGRLVEAEGGLRVPRLLPAADRGRRREEDREGGHGGP